MFRVHPSDSIVERHRRSVFSLFAEIKGDYMSKKLKSKQSKAKAQARRQRLKGRRAQLSSRVKGNAVLAGLSSNYSGPMPLWLLVL
jgi:hypothetical protein